MIEAALRAAAVPPFHAMEMSRAASERQAAGHRILHLEIGQPSTGLPRLARDAVAVALDAPLGYTNAGGLDSLRRRLARWHGEVRTDEAATAARRSPVAPGRIIVVAGASAGFTLAFLTLFEPGDRVAVIEPGYPCYRNTLIALGIEPVPIPVGPDTRWAPSAAHLAAAGHIDGIVLASPSNPTGTVLTDAAMADVTQYCRDHDIAVVADEIYHGIVDGDAAPRVLDHHPDAFVVNSFSKYFSMTGWRVGWVVVPDHLVDTVERLQQNLYICAPHVSQVGALAALDATEELDGHVEQYRSNRRLALDGLAAAGIVDTAPADGAFYVYAHVPQYTAAIGIDSMTLCRRWLAEADVATTPGIDFDLARGHEYVRFSYAGSGADIAEACERLGAWRP